VVVLTTEKIVSYCSAGLSHDGLRDSYYHGQYKRTCLADCLIFEHPFLLVVDKAVEMEGLYFEDVSSSKSHKKTPKQSPPGTKAGWDNPGQLGNQVDTKS
jgi:hypothetical protein